MYNILFLSDCLCTFCTEILTPLEVFKNSLFYNILKDFLITPVNLKYAYAIQEDSECTRVVSCPARNELII